MPIPKICAPVLALAVGLGLAVSPVAALAADLPSDGVYGDHIDWGVIMDLSGPASPSQIIWTNGLKDYVRMVDDAGGINGRKVNLLVEDNRFDPSLDRVAFEKLSNQKPVLGISGMGNANGQVALNALIRRGKVPVLGSYTTARTLTEPPTPMFYGGFCGYNEMASVGTGFLTEQLKLKAPKVVTVHLDTAGGKEYADYVAAAVKRAGGTHIAVAIKPNAADATAQVLEINNAKPDFIAVHGTTTTPILLLRGMQQYGLTTPVFGMAYIGTPVVYNSLPPEAGNKYSFVSCFTPGGAGATPALKTMDAHADQYGHSAMKADLNYVAGWTIGKLITDAIAKLGPDVSREKLVAMLNKGFSIDTEGLSAPISYTADNHRGLVELKPFTYDYATRQFMGHGNYDDYNKYVQ
jgi:branched-chain amino acid transport system substrate-binding protein